VNNLTFVDDDAVRSGVDDVFDTVRICDKAVWEMSEAFVWSLRSWHTDSDGIIVIRMM
jgi:hypothetical protein